MRKLSYFFRSVKLSVRLKSVPSRIVSVVGFGAAFLPMLLSLRLAVFADIVQQLFGEPALLGTALLSFGGVVLLYLVQTVFNLVWNYYTKEDAVRIKRYVKEETLGLLGRIPYRYIENYDDFREKFTFIKSYGGEKTAGSISLILRWLANLLSFVSVAAILSAVSLWIVVALIAACIPAAVLSMLQKDETYRMRTKWMKEGRLTIHYSDICRMNEPMKEIRFFGLYPYIKEKWRSLSGGYIDKKKKITGKHVLYNSIADLLRNGVYLIVILITVREIFQNPARGLGTFMLVLASAEQLQSVTTTLLVNAVSVLADMRYIEDFLKLLEMEGDSVKRDSEVSENDAQELTRRVLLKSKGGMGNGIDGSTEITDAVHEGEGCEIKPGSITIETDAAHEREGMAEPYRKADIDFENVSFTYPGSVIKALDNVTIKIRQGEKIAIVGANGSGKSTFISLLCGFYQPDSGTVRVNGMDIMKNLEKLRRSISAIFQTFCQYQDTLRNNITISDPGRAQDDEEIMSLAAGTGADEMIKNQKNTLDEVVGIFSDRGNNLSGGQWQKIAITRALYRKKACMYILDEPTAALDPLGEANLYRNFGQLTGDKTTILISHRLGITKVVDRILVFDKGKIVEDGSHAELMAKNGLYADMYKAQARWYT